MAPKSLDFTNIGGSLELSPIVPQIIKTRYNLLRSFTTGASELMEKKAADLQKTHSRITGIVAPCAKALMEKKAAQNKGPKITWPRTSFFKVLYKSRLGYNFATDPNHKCSEGPDMNNPTASIRNVLIASHRTTSPSFAVAAVIPWSTPQQTKLWSLILAPTNTLCLLIPENSHAILYCSWSNKSVPHKFLQPNSSAVLQESQKKEKVQLNPKLERRKKTERQNQNNHNDLLPPEDGVSLYLGCEVRDCVNGAGCQGFGAKRVLLKLLEVPDHELDVGSRSRRNGGRLRCGAPSIARARNRPLAPQLTSSCPKRHHVMSISWCCSSSSSSSFWNSCSKKMGANCLHMWVGRWVVFLLVEVGEKRCAVLTVVAASPRGEAQHHTVFYSLKQLVQFLAPPTSNSTPATPISSNNLISETTDCGDDRWCPSRIGVWCSTFVKP